MLPAMRVCNYLRAGTLSARLYRRAGWGLMLLLVAITGCSPYSTAVKIGVRLVGDVIEDEDVKQRNRALIGRPVSAADETFGQPIDVFREVQGQRCWSPYHVQFDVLGRQRYVVAASHRRAKLVEFLETAHEFAVNPFQASFFRRGTSRLHQEVALVGIPSRQFIARA